MQRVRKLKLQFITITSTFIASTRCKCASDICTLILNADRYLLDGNCRITPFMHCRITPFMSRVRSLRLLSFIPLAKTSNKISGMVLLCEQWATLLTFCYINLAEGEHLLRRTERNWLITATRYIMTWCYMTGIWRVLTCYLW